MKRAPDVFLRYCSSRFGRVSPRAFSFSSTIMMSSSLDGCSDLASAHRTALGKLRTEPRIACWVQQSVDLRGGEVGADPFILRQQLAKSLALSGGRLCGVVHHVMCSLAPELSPQL